MYRTKKPSDALIQQHYNQYGATVRQLMQALLDGNTVSPIRSSVSNIRLKVKNGSATHQFLTKYVQEENLRRLLLGNWQDLLNIVEEVRGLVPDMEWQKVMLKGRLDNGDYVIDGHDDNGHPLTDHFHDILYWLFVKQMYEGENEDAPFNKSTFISERKVDVCPYCGRQKTVMAEETDRPDSKPPIDHFLPKSKYPFLAMSVYNLIPCCTFCNELANKGDFDPLEFAPLVKKLLNPHEFNDNAIRFSFAYNNNGDMNENNFKIYTAAADTHLEEGYNHILKLRAFYKQETLQMKQIYRGFTKATESMKKYLEKLGVDDWFLECLTQMSLGYELNDDDADKILFYKFRKEVFGQLLHEYGLA